MPYTNIELVRKYLPFGDFPASRRRNLEIIFEGLDSTTLPGRGIVPGSLTVKAMRMLAPFFEQKALGAEPVTLSRNLLVPDSVTVASDSSLGLIYTPQVDYAVDNEAGLIYRVPDGDIGEGADVAVWYYHYRAYIEGTDFIVDYQRGTIRRLAAGHIMPGQLVRVDYQMASGAFDEDVVNEAVAAANAIIEKEVDPLQKFGADASLQTAATFLAASILCQITAGYDLIQTSPGKSRGDSWITLAEGYRRDYERLIADFHPPSNRLSGPRRT